MPESQIVAILDPLPRMLEMPYTLEDWPLWKPGCVYNVLFHDNRRCAVDDVSCPGWVMYYDVRFLGYRWLEPEGFVLEFALMPPKTVHIIRFNLEDYSVFVRYVSG